MYKFNLQVEKSPKNVSYVPNKTPWGDVSIFKKHIKGTRSQRYIDHQTSLEIDKEFQERCEAAYRFGVEDGRQIGDQEGKEAILPVVEGLKQTRKAFFDKMETLTRDADEMIVRLALSLSKAILHKEAQVDPSIVKTIAKESLKLVEDRQRISIRIHPNDLKIIQEFKEEIAAPTQGIRHIEIKEDERISPGGCVISSDSGLVDAQFDVQLEEMAQSLLEAVS